MPARRLGNRIRTRCGRRSRCSETRRGRQGYWSETRRGPQRRSPKRRHVRQNRCPQTQFGHQRHGLEKRHARQNRCPQTHRGPPSRNPEIRHPRQTRYPEAQFGHRSRYPKAQFGHPSRCLETPRARPSRCSAQPYAWRCRRPTIPYRACHRPGAPYRSRRPRSRSRPMLNRNQPRATARRNPLPSDVGRSCRRPKRGIRSANHRSSAHSACLARSTCSAHSTYPTRPVPPALPAYSAHPESDQAPKRPPKILCGRNAVGPSPRLLRLLRPPRRRASVAPPGSWDAWGPWHSSRSPDGTVAWDAAVRGRVALPCSCTPRFLVPGPPFVRTRAGVHLPLLVYGPASTPLSPGTTQKQSRPEHAYPQRRTAIPGAVERPAAIPPCVRVTLRVAPTRTGTSPRPRGICPERPPTLR